MRWVRIIASAVPLLVACSGSDGVDWDQERPFVLTGLTNLREIAQLTGPGAMNDTEPVAVAGTDLGSMVDVGDRTFFVFGDTFGVRADDAFGGGGGNWRSNALAFTTDDDPTDGITFDGWIVDDVGFARAPIPGDHDANGTGEVTKIPTHGFVVDGEMYLHFMSVHSWDDPGMWQANYAGLARSGDEGRTWETLGQPRWAGDSNFVQVAPHPVADTDGDHIYFWSIPAGRFGGVKLMKVPAEVSAVEDPGAYRYFTGTGDDGAPIWSERPSDATTVLDGAVGELSVVYNHHLDRWLMSYTTDENAVISEGITPWGPWSSPHVITTQSDHPGLYAPYMNPRYVSEDGRTVFFSMSLWGPYNVFWFSIDLVTDRENSGSTRSP